MKRLAILATFVLATQACHKKEYALFKDPAASPYLYQETSRPAAIEELYVSTEMDIGETLPEERQVDVSQPYSNPALSKAENPQRVAIKKKPIKAKKLTQQKANPSFQGKTDEPMALSSRGLGIASLVFGAAGLLLLIPTLITMELLGVGFAGILLGVTGLVLAIIRILRVKKSPDAPSENNGDDAATIGVVLSTTAIVGGIMVLGIVVLVNALLGF